MVAYMDEFLTFCNEKKIPIVTSAGNQGEIEFVRDGIPQLLGESHKEMIIVGAVEQSGSIWADTAKEPTGLISVYAPGSPVKVPSVGDVIPANTLAWAGTSHAAAITVSVVSILFTWKLTAL